MVLGAGHAKLPLKERQAGADRRRLLGRGQAKGQRRKGVAGGNPAVPSIDEIPVEEEPALRRPEPAADQGGAQGGAGFPDPGFGSGAPGLTAEEGQVALHAP